LPESNEKHYSSEDNKGGISPEVFLEEGRNVLFEWLVVDPRTKFPRRIEEVIEALLSLSKNKEMT